ncbi:UDP-glucuronosyltransferase like transferase [Gordonia terrae C-6]|uniref:UDP-glucuronosyltransferase like transferase n=1 Tax=Gordonia terrae C-6 TaxID=1316928 RepID=R7Y8R5_9ACTN|nr:glycosyltransferase [Gordonia terrae]EON32421.1 UDP-glucuronosyltransferase like transferase [Gordonia terrae C-6]
MRISFVVNGTRGDVQPATLLATALARRGHDVRLGVPPNMVRPARGWADGVARLEVVPLGQDTRAHLESVARARKQAGRHPLRRLRVFLSLRNAGWEDLVSDMTGVVDGADVIVSGLITEQPALAFAESAGVPLVSLHHAPVRRNSRVGPVPGHLPGGPRAVRAQWAAYDAAFGVLTRRRERRLRAELGSTGTSRPYTARLRAAAGLELQAYDPMFGVHDDQRWIADTAARPRPSVGFLGLPGEHPVAGSDALASWLDGGDAPIYVGFGSMALRGEESTLRVVAELGRRLGRRVLVCAGWTELSAEVRTGAESDAVRIESQVDHRTVFGRCAVVVHHGGAGTTAAVLRAGRPSVICWYGADQPFWGAELERLGVGVSMPMARAGRDLDVDRLCDAVAAMLDPAVAERAARLRDVLVAEDVALADAVHAVESSVTSSCMREPSTRGPQMHSETKVDV